MQALSEIPVAQVAKTFSQLKSEDASRRLSEEDEERETLNKLESQAILAEIGGLQEAREDNQVGWEKFRSPFYFPTFR